MRTRLLLSCVAVRTALGLPSWGSMYHDKDCTIPFRACANVQEAMEDFPNSKCNWMDFMTNNGATPLDTPMDECGAGLGYYEAYSCAGDHLVETMYRDDKCAGPALYTGDIPYGGCVSNPIWHGVFFKTFWKGGCGRAQDATELTVKQQSSRMDTAVISVLGIMLMLVSGAASCYYRRGVPSMSVPLLEEC